MDERSSTAQNVRRFENPDEAYIEKLKARIAELEAKIERLESRGITDMQHRIAELEGLLRRWVESQESFIEFNKLCDETEEALRGEGEDDTTD